MDNFLVTGGAGFIGSHLTQTLLQEGHRVSVLDNLSTGTLANISHLFTEPGFRFVHDSVTNEGALEPLIADCDVVFHLAAVVGVQRILERTIDTIETNVLGAEVVLRLAHRHHKKVLIVSSSEVYGKSSDVPFQEDQDVLLGPTIKPRWSYAATKTLDEFLALAYHRQRGLPVVIARLFNIIGPRQSGQYGMVVPRFVQQSLSGQPLTVFGDGQQTRCFLHVEDAVRAIICLVKNPAAVGQVFNVGSDVEVSILDLARRVLAMARGSGEQSAVKGSDNTAPEDVVLVPYEQALGSDFEDTRRRVPDISKIRRLTGWEPRLTLAESLQTIIDWYQVGLTEPAEARQSHPGR